jgi:hypothetical protein
MIATSRVVATPAVAPTPPPALPTNVALGPTCPCTSAPLPIKKADVPKKSDDRPAKKKRDDDPPKRTSSRSRLRDADPVVYGPPVGDDDGPPVRVPPVGFGIGIGGYVAAMAAADMAAVRSAIPAVVRIESCRSGGWATGRRLICFRLLPPHQQLLKPQLK